MSDGLELISATFLVNPVPGNENVFSQHYVVQHKHLNDFQVVQVYMSWPSTVNVPVPKLQLVDFERVQIADHYEVRVTFFIKPEQMAVWMDDSTGWDIPTGKLDMKETMENPHR